MSVLSYAMVQETAKHLSATAETLYLIHYQRQRQRRSQRQENSWQRQEPQTLEQQEKQTEFRLWRWKLKHFVMKLNMKL